MLNLINTIFKNTKYKIYKFYLFNDEKELISVMTDKDKTIDYVKNLIDNEIRSFNFNSQNVHSFIEEFILHRQHIYNIENIEEFNEIEYIKENAQKIFNDELSQAINNRFKEIKKTNELNYLKDIENCEVKKVKNIDNGFEIIYKKDNKENSLTLTKSTLENNHHILKIDNKKTNSPSTYSPLNDIKTILKIFYLDNETSQQIEIMYIDKNKQTNSYRLTLEEKDYQQYIIDIKKYENIFSFIEDSEKSTFELSYDEKYIYIRYDLESVIKDKDDYDLFYPCALGKKISFKIDQKSGIKVFNTSNFNSITILNLKYLESLTKKRKAELLHFLGIAELYINSLYANQDFENEILIKDEKKLDLLNKKLESNIWKKQLIFTDNENKKEATRIIYKFTNNTTSFLYLWETNFSKNKTSVRIKFKDEIKDFMYDFFKHLNISCEKKVEVWYQYNFELSSNKFTDKYLRGKYNSTIEAINYIKNELDKELINIQKTNEKFSEDELINKYKESGTSYYLKNTKKNFDSFNYVKYNIKNIISNKKNQPNKKDENIFNFLFDSIKEKSKF